MRRNISMFMICVAATALAVIYERFGPVASKSLVSCVQTDRPGNAAQAEATPDGAAEKPIRWVDFTVTAPALREGARLDCDSRGGQTPCSWIELLAVYAARHGGSFAAYRMGDLTALLTDIRKTGESVDAYGCSLKNPGLYRYYRRAYHAVLDGILGSYRTLTVEDEGESLSEETYGVRARFPIAAGFGFSEYDDFGAARSYGFRRHHLGHDMLGAVGTPIVAVESGYCEALGWNQYGGWRIGIRSLDGTRYYYYAHLRRGHPYCDMFEGKFVRAGEVIGYLGMTGYSAKEDVNNIDTPHLHIGLQLIFSPEQKDAVCEIWIDFYELSKFLSDYRSETKKIADGKESRSMSAVQPCDFPED